jgi:hypothetical protein
MSRSRLDSCIARLVAQRDALAWARDVAGEVPGPVLEVGLGNGRTYDHLRHLFPDRPIWAFDRALAAHPRCVPPDALLILGELRETLPGAADRIGEPACLVHADLGFGVPETDEAMARFLDAWIFGLAAPGGPRALGPGASLPSRVRGGQPARGGAGALPRLQARAQDGRAARGALR